MGEFSWLGYTLWLSYELYTLIAGADDSSWQWDVNKTVSLLIVLILSTE